MENKQNLNINDNYTNFTDLSEFRVNVEAEMAELDRLFSDSTPNHHQSSSLVSSQNDFGLEINDNYTHFTNLSEFRIDVEAEMAEVDRLFGDVPSIPQVKTIPNSHEQTTQNTSVQNIPQTTAVNHNPQNSNLNDFTNLLINLQNEVSSLNANLNRLEKTSFPTKTKNAEIINNTHKTDELLHITKMLFEKLTHIEHLLNVRS